VFEAREGSEALAILASNERCVDVLVTDLVMPNMPGRELAKRARDRFPSLEIIFMSGYADHAAVEQGLLESTAEFLQKPISAESLVQKVRDVIDRRPQARRLRTDDNNHLS
jgi:YesN/AraC family two-component response regulator